MEVSVSIKNKKLSRKLSKNHKYLKKHTKEVKCIKCIEERDSCGS